MLLYPCHWVQEAEVSRARAQQGRQLGSHPTLTVQMAFITIKPRRPPSKASSNNHLWRGSNCESVGLSQGSDAFSGVCDKTELYQTSQYTDQLRFVVKGKAAPITLLSVMQLSQTEGSSKKRKAGNTTPLHHSQNSIQ